MLKCMYCGLGESLWAEEPCPGSSSSCHVHGPLYQKLVEATRSMIDRVYERNEMDVYAVRWLATVPKMHVYNLSAFALAVCEGGMEGIEGSVEDMIS